MAYKTQSLRRAERNVRAHIRIFAAPFRSGKLNNSKYILDLLCGI
jgi:hypothetical protein